MRGLAFRTTESERVAKFTGGCIATLGGWTNEQEVDALIYLRTLRRSDSDFSLSGVQGPYS